MYNRYVPQSDGTYHRKRMPEKITHPKPQKTHIDPCPPPPCQESVPPITPPIQIQKQNYYQKNEGNVTSFLRNLLPKNFDTGDLLIVLLLLLMAGDCPDDQNTALLTLALYFIM